MSKLNKKIVFFVLCACIDVVFTVTACTAGRFRGPVSHRRAGEDVWTVGHVARVTAVLQHCAHWERAPVGLRQVSRTMLHCGGPHATYDEQQFNKTTIRKRQLVDSWIHIVTFFVVIFNAERSWKKVLKWTKTWTHNRIQTCIQVLRRGLTVAANTAGRLWGPVPHRGADDGAASDGQVTGVTRVLDDCAHREQAAVAVCQIRRAVLQCGRSNTTFTRRQNEKMLLWSLQRSVRASGVHVRAVTKRHNGINGTSLTMLLIKSPWSKTFHHWAVQLLCQVECLCFLQLLSHCDLYSAASLWIVHWSTESFNKTHYYIFQFTYCWFTLFLFGL